MNQEYALTLLRRMVEIPSLSGREAPLAAFLTGEMERLGLKSHIDAAGNAVGERVNGAGPVIMLLGHMDTVPGEIPVRQEGRLLYGRGTVDAKGPLAAFLCAASALPDLPGRLIVIGAVEEETDGSRGAHYLLDRYDPDAVIIGEPSGWSAVTLGYKGRISFTYAVSRPQSHSAGPGEKASEVAVAFWNQVLHHADRLGGDRSAFYRPQPSLTLMQGTAEEARLEVSLRIPPDFDLDGFKRFLEEIRGDGSLRYAEVTPAILTDRSTPPARALCAAIRTHGGKPGLKVKTGTSDMNTVSKRWNVPMVAYGPGDSALDHTPDEHIDLDEYLLAIRVLTDGLCTLAEELTRSPRPKPAGDGAFTEEEEEELSRRLQALGYLD